MLEDLLFSDVRLIGKVEGVLPGAGMTVVSVQVAARNGTRSTVEVTVIEEGYACAAGDLVLVHGELTSSGVSLAPGFSEFKVIVRAPALATPEAPAASEAAGGTDPQQSPDTAPTPTPGSTPARLAPRPFPAAPVRAAVRPSFGAPRPERPAAAPEAALPPPPGGLTVTRKEAPAQVVVAPAAISAAVAPAPAAPPRASFGARPTWSRQPAAPAAIPQKPVPAAAAPGAAAQDTAPRTPFGPRRSSSLVQREDAPDSPYKALDSSDGDGSGGAARHGAAEARGPSAPLQRPATAPPTKPDAIDLEIPY